MFARGPDRWAQEPAIADIADYNTAKFFADEWLVRPLNKTSQTVSYLLLSSVSFPLYRPSSKV